jgi:energy-converting hydrogenase B subunit D
VTALLVLSLTLVGVAGTAVVLSRRPERQVVTYSLFGLTLGVLFLALQAPDVALSQVTVGAAVTPMMILLAIRTMNKDQKQQREREDS